MNFEWSLFLVGSFSSLLRETVAEFTLADHKGATTTSSLQSLCHKDDSILLGAWVQDTDHRKVEEQVGDDVFSTVIITTYDDDLRFLILIGFKICDNNDLWYFVLVLLEASKYAMIMIYDSWYWLW